MKLFMAVILEGKNFKPSLMFDSKAVAYKVEHLSVTPLYGRLLTLAQT